MSQLIFDPATGLLAPDTAEIRAGVAGDWQQAFFAPDHPALDTEPTTPAGQLRPWAFSGFRKTPLTPTRNTTGRKNCI